MPSSAATMRKLDELFRQSLCEPGPPRTGIHVSSLLGCIRRSYYNKVLGFNPTIESIIRMRIGTECHNIKLFPSETYKDDDVVHEKSMEWEGIKGTMDEFYKGVIVDKKTTRAVPSRAKDGHVQQVQYYQVLAEEAGFNVKEGAICYIDVNNCFFRHLSVPLSSNTDKVKAEMITRRDILLKSLEMEAPPRREPQWCNTCEFGKICYGG